MPGWLDRLLLRLARLTLPNHGREWMAGDIEEDYRRLAETRGEHKVSVDLAAGSHMLSVQDEEGASAEASFQAFRRASAEGEFIH